MKARDVREHILRRAPWVDPQNTVDTFKHGDPDVEVCALATTWMLTMKAVDEAERLGVNLVVTHEPTFFSHHDALEDVRNDEVYRAKRRRLDRAGLTVLRIHDAWDTWPGIGIGDSLAAALDLKIVAQADSLIKVGATPKPVSLGRFATFARKRLGMDGVALMGDPAATVRRVALSFGALGGLDAMRKFLALKPDVLLAGELTNWREIRYLADAACPVILADHATTEEPGMRSLATYLHETFRVPAHFIPVGSCLRTWTK